MDIEVYESSMRKRLDTNQSILKNAIPTSIQKLKNDVAMLEAFWSGSDHDHFVKIMDSFSEDLKKLEDALVSYHDFLNGYLEAMVKLHQEYGMKKLNLK